MAFHKKKTNVTSSILVEQSQPIDVSTKNINWFLCVWDQNLYLHLWKEESMHHILYQKQMIIWHFNFCLLITKLPLCLFTSRSQTQTRRSWHKNRERFDIFCKTNLKLRGIAPESVLIQWKNWRARLSYSKHLLSNTFVSTSFLIHFWSLQFLMSSRHCRALTLSIPSMQSRCPSTWYLAPSVEYFENIPRYLATKVQYLRNTPGYLTASVEYFQNTPRYLAVSVEYFQNTPRNLAVSVHFFQKTPCSRLIKIGLCQKMVAPKVS